MQTTIKEKILEKLNAEIQKNTNARKENSDNIEAALNSRFIHKYGPIAARFIKYFLIISIILITLLITKKIQITNIISILIPTITPLISLTLSLISYNNWKKQNHVIEDIKKYIKVKTNQEKIIEEVKARIREEQNQTREVLYDEAFFKQKNKPPKFIPSTNLEDAQTRLNRLEDRLKNKLNYLDNLNSQDILYHQFIGAIDENSVLIKSIMNTFIIGSPSLIYSTIMMLIFNLFATPIVNITNISNIIFFIIALIGGLVSNIIVNKITDDEINAYNQLLKDLNMPNFNIEEYNKGTDNSRIFKSLLEELSTLVIEIEHLKIEIENFKTLPPKEQFIKKYQYSHKLDTTKDIDYSLFEITTPEINIKIPRRRIPEKKD